MSHKSLADELELWGVEKDFTLFTDGSIGFGLDVTPKDVSSLSDESLTSLQSS